MSRKSAGGGLAQTIAGPAPGLVADLLKVSVGNVQQAVAGKDPKTAAELLRLARQNTPGGSLWYARLALDRLLWDNLQRHVDPDHRAAWRRMERRAHRELETGYWWRPGDTLPDRAPDLSNMMETAP